VPPAVGVKDIEGVPRGSISANTWTLQLASSKAVYFTEPVGAKPDTPVTDELSDTCPPIVIAPAVSIELIEGVAFRTVSGSHPLVSDR
jgi:hypothetical protein